MDHDCPLTRQSIPLASGETCPHCKELTITPAERLEHLRQAIRAERISWGELAELQSLADHIDPGDVELLEWAGVPEHEES